MSGTHDARERILAAAGSLFYNHGVSSTGVDAIAQAAGVGKMSLYRHFEGKDDLVLEALREKGEPNLDWLLPESPRGEDGLLGMFDRIADAALGSDFHGCPFVRASIELPRDHPAQVVGRRQRMALTDRVERHLAASGIASPRLLAEQLVVLVGGAATECVVQGSSTPAVRGRELARTVIEASRRPPPG